MDTRSLVAIVGILAALVVAAILRYRSKGEAKFSIRDWLTFSFRGSNVPDDNKTSRRESGATADNLQVIANEFVGRDKITHIHPSSTEFPPTSQLPELVLKLFLTSGVYQDEITLRQPQPDGVVQDHQYMFGLALQNTAVTSIPAKEINIRVQIFWNGDHLQSAPSFTTDTRQRTTPGWKTSKSHVEQAEELPLPAVLEFAGSEQDRCAFGHPLEWTRFRMRMPRKANGYFTLHYRVTSASPHTTSTGELRIVLR